MRINKPSLRDLAILALIVIGIALINGKSTGVTTTSGTTMSGDKLDAIVKAKATADGFGMTAQQYFAYETAADKAGITPQQWYHTMTQFTRRMNDLKRRGSSSLFNQLYSLGAGPYVASVSAGNTTTVQALEQSLDFIQALKQNNSASAAAMLSDEIGLGVAGSALKREDVNSEMSHFTFLTDEFFTKAKKERDALIDAGRR